MLPLITEINFAPLVDSIVALAAAAVFALAGVIGRMIHARTGIELDLKHNSILNESIEKGVAYAHSISKDLSVSTKNDLIGAAANYVIKGAPDALNHFGITPERLTEMIEARL